MGHSRLRSGLRLRLRLRTAPSPPDDACFPLKNPCFVAKLSTSEAVMGAVKLQ